MEKTTTPTSLTSNGLTGQMAPGGAATELKIIASGAFKGAMQHLQSAYEKASGNTLVISWGPSMGESAESIPQRITHKEPMDLAIMASETLDQLASTGAFILATRTNVATSRIGAGVPQGQPKPDISSPAALRQALLDASKVAYSQGASGVHIAATLFDALGIAEQMEAKTIVIEGRELVGTALARGDATFGMQQVSELKVTPGVDYLGPLPEALQKISLFTAVVARDSRQQVAAQSFIQYLTSKAGTELLEQSGLEPGT